MASFGSIALLLLKKTAEVFAGNDESAAMIGRQADPLLVRCQRVTQLSWKLKIRVTGRVNQRYTNLPASTGSVDWADTSVDARPLQMTGAAAGITAEITGSGPHLGSCTAEADGWYLEQQQRVSIDDGEDQTIDLVLLPLPWVGVNVVDHKSGNQIKGLTIASEYRRHQQAKGAVQNPLPDGLNLEFERLHPGSDLKIEEMIHPDRIYEAVGDVVSTDQ